MPPMKILPISSDPRLQREAFRADSAKPVPKSRLKRLFDRPFPSVLRISSATEKPVAGDTQSNRDGEFEPSSLCLAKMVQNFIEESNEKQSAAKCAPKRCNCFNGNGNDSSDDEFDGFNESASVGSPGDACDTLKVRMRRSVWIFHDLSSGCSEKLENRSSIFSDRSFPFLCNCMQ